MKIELTEEILTSIVTKVNDAVNSTVRAEIDEIEDQALVDELKADCRLDAKAKVMAYLQRTKKAKWDKGQLWAIIDDTVLRKALGITVFAMKKLRDALWNDGDLFVGYGKRGQLTLHHLQKELDDPTEPPGDVAETEPPDTTKSTQ